VGREQATTPSSSAWPPGGLEDRPLARSCPGSGACSSSAARRSTISGRAPVQDKYDPVWQPRYIAAARKWAIPILLADVGLLSSGGMAGLTRRSRKPEDRVLEPREAA